MELIVFPFASPKVLVKISGTKTATAQTTPKPITKANVFGQVEQPKQPSADAPSSSWEDWGSLINDDAVVCKDCCSEGKVHELVPFNPNDDGGYWYKNQ